LVIEFAHVFTLQYQILVFAIDDDVLFERVPFGSRRGCDFVMSASPELLPPRFREVFGELFDVSPLSISPGSPWENGHAGSFDSRLRDEFLDCEVFDDVQAAQSLGTA
jgi:hypothetical protein